MGSSTQLRARKVSIWRSINCRILRYRYGGRNLRALLPCYGLDKLWKWKVCMLV
jgi:hypothetical protein